MLGDGRGSFTMDKRFSEASHKSTPGAWNIGVLFSRTGSMHIGATQHVYGAMLAIEELNAAGAGRFAIGSRKGGQE